MCILGLFLCEPLIEAMTYIKLARQERDRFLSIYYEILIADKSCLHCCFAALCFSPSGFLTKKGTLSLMLNFNNYRLSLCRFNRLFKVNSL